MDYDLTLHSLSSLPTLVAALHDSGAHNSSGFFGRGALTLSKYVNPRRHADPHSPPKLLQYPLHPRLGTFVAD